MDELLDNVFPAYAGVILRQKKIAVLLIGFPRIRGGDPIAVYNIQRNKVFSPHPRG